MNGNEIKLLVAIRLRGRVNVSPDIEKTLTLLRLRRKFNAVLLAKKPEVIGMLEKVKSYATWGEINQNVLALLLEYRGRLKGDKKLSADYLKKYGVKSFEELAEKLVEGKIRLKALNDLRPFRLRPPKGGFECTIKRLYGNKGEAGYRGEEINNLLLKMI